MVKTTKKTSSFTQGFQNVLKKVSVTARVLDFGKLGATREIYSAVLKINLLH